MSSKFLDLTGVTYFWGKIKTLLDTKVDKVSGKQLSTNDFTTAEKNKLSGISTGANKTTVDSALSSSSTNPVQNKVINAALETKVDAVEGKQLSTEDFTSAEKTKLTGIATGANNYTLPVASGTVLGGIKIGDNLTIDSNGKLSAVQGTYTLPKASSSTLGGIKVGSNLSVTSAGVLSATDTTYSAATSSASGLMSAADKTKLDAFSAASDYAKKTDLTNVYRYMGSVETYSDLPTSGNTPGDVYDVQDNGQNYAWTSDGTWDTLGEVFQVDAITNSEIDTMMS